MLRCWDIYWFKNFIYFKKIKIRMAKIVAIYHSRDHDGFMSAAIVKRWFNNGGISSNTNFSEDPYRDTLFKNNKRNTVPKVEPNSEIAFLGYDYGQPEPDLSEADSVIICDVSFKPEYMKMLHDRLGDKLIWIDHHISAIKDMSEAGLDSMSGVRDTKMSACELTWTYFYPGQIPRG